MNDFLDGKYQLQPLTGDCSPKKIIRVKSLEDSSTYILIEFPTDKKSDEFFMIDHTPMTINQFNFFQNALHTLSIRLPMVPTIKLADEEKKSLLITDLGDYSLADAWLNDKNRTDRPMLFYHHLISWLGKLSHVVLPQNNYICARTLEEKAMKAELDDFCLCFLDQENLEENEIKVVDKMLTSMCESINRYRPNIIHRDFQSRNVMIHEGNPYIIDFQDMCLGPPLYDLASLLFDSNAKLQSTNRLFLALMFRRDYMPSMPLDDFINLLLETAVQRVLKNMGRHMKYYYQNRQESSLQRVRNNYQLLIELSESFYDQRYQPLFEIIIPIIKNKIH